MMKKSYMSLYNFIFSIQKEIKCCCCFIFIQIIIELDKKMFVIKRSEEELNFNMEKTKTLEYILVILILFRSASLKEQISGLQSQNRLRVLTHGYHIPY
jgi:hypothetical protein